MFTGGTVTFSAINIHAILLPTAMYVDQCIRPSMGIYTAEHGFVVGLRTGSNIRVLGGGKGVAYNNAESQVGYLKSRPFGSNTDSFGIVWAKANLGPMMPQSTALVPYVGHNPALMLPANNAHLNMLPNVVDEILMLPGKVPSNLRESNLLLVSEGVSNPVLDNTRTGSALKPYDGQHGFNDIIDNYAKDAQKFDLIGGDKVQRELYQIKGGQKSYEYKQIYDKTQGFSRNERTTIDQDGIFEWIVDPVEGVTHRRFIPGGEIIGKSNQVPGK